MIKKYLLTFCCCLPAAISFGQSDTGAKAPSGVFARIAREVASFQIDTSAVPDDKVTRTIRELRSLRGVFNIDEVIEFKLAEDRQKKELPEAELDKLAQYFRSGNGKRWLENAVIRIYRQHFTYEELRQLVRFYQSSAGQKMATEFPVIMIQSLKAAEVIKSWQTGQQATPER